MIVDRLRQNFIGKGEVKGFAFNEVFADGDYRIYYVNGDNYHYEVFKVKITPLCIDFENRLYSETHFKEVYPKSKDFGVTAWNAKNYDSAMERIKKIKESNK